jgi:hypothetical protein
LCLSDAETKIALLVADGEDPWRKETMLFPHGAGNLGGVQDAASPDATRYCWNKLAFLGKDRWSKYNLCQSVVHVTLAKLYFDVTFGTTPIAHVVKAI